MGLEKFSPRHATLDKWPSENREEVIPFFEHHSPPMSIDGAIKRMKNTINYTRANAVDSHEHRLFLSQTRHFHLFSHSRRIKRRLALRFSAVSLFLLSVVCAFSTVFQNQLIIYFVHPHPKPQIKFLVYFLQNDLQTPRSGLPHQPKCALPRRREDGLAPRRRRGMERR